MPVIEQERQSVMFVFHVSSRRPEVFKRYVGKIRCWSVSAVIQKRSEFVYVGKSPVCVSGVSQIFAVFKGFFPIFACSFSFLPDETCCAVCHDLVSVCCRSRKGCFIRRFTADTAKSVSVACRRVSEKVRAFIV